MNVQVVGAGSYLPGDPISNEELEQFAGPLPADVLAGIQVESRHWMIDHRTGEHRINNSEMATAAARDALRSASLAPEDVGLVVVSTASPDYLLPPMATFVQQALGLERCATLEVRSGCAGFVEALDVARLYLERGAYATALVIGSEAISPLLVPLFLGKRPDDIRMRDRMNLYSFGDGAGAVVLRAANLGEGIVGSAMASIGGCRKPGMQIVGAGTHSPIHEQLQAKRLVDLKVDILESARYTPYVLTEAVREVLRAAATDADEVDVCLIPEGNAGYLTEEVSASGRMTPEWAALQDKVVENLALVGATGSAAVPLALDHAWKTGAVSEGDTVMLLAIETSKWKYAGSVLQWTAALPGGGRDGRVAQSSSTAI